MCSLMSGQPRTVVRGDAQRARQRIHENLKIHRYKDAGLSRNLVSFFSPQHASLPLLSLGIRSLGHQEVISSKPFQDSRLSAFKYNNVYPRIRYPRAGGHGRIHGRCASQCPRIDLAILSNKPDKPLSSAPRRCTMAQGVRLELTQQDYPGSSDCFCPTLQRLPRCAVQ